MSIFSLNLLFVFTEFTLDSLENKFDIIFLIYTSLIGKKKFKKSGCRIGYSRHISVTKCVHIRLNVYPNGMDGMVWDGRGIKSVLQFRLYFEGTYNMY